VIYLTMLSLTQIIQGPMTGLVNSEVKKDADGTVKYNYGFCASRTIEWLHCKLQTRPLVREGAPQKQARNFWTATFLQVAIYGHKSQSELDTKTYWITVSRKVTSTLTLNSTGKVVVVTLFVVQGVARNP
jgi:hypothetical protein